jgi:hypothetical protein
VGSAVTHDFRLALLRASHPERSRNDSASLDPVKCYLNIMLALGALAGRRREQLQRFADLLISGHRAATMTNCPNLAGPKQTAGSNSVPV